MPAHRRLTAVAQHLRHDPCPSPVAVSAGPRLFDYETIVANVHVRDALPAVEQCFASLAKGLVDVPFPMHIAVAETAAAGPGDCHVKGGYISGEDTCVRLRARPGLLLPAHPSDSSSSSCCRYCRRFTVKVATVSFVKNIEKGLAPGGGMFLVFDAADGQIKGIFQENRFMTDVRTGE